MDMCRTLERARHNGNIVLKIRKRLERLLLNVPFAPARVEPDDYGRMEVVVLS